MKRAPTTPSEPPSAPHSTSIAFHTIPSRVPWSAWPTSIAAEYAATSSAPRSEALALGPSALSALNPTSAKAAMLYAFRSTTWNDRNGGDVRSYTSLLTAAQNSVAATTPVTAVHAMRAVLQPRGSLMIVRPFHVFRALAAAGALLLAAAPLGSAAQEKPQPIVTASPGPAAPAPTSDGSTTSPTIHAGDHLAISVYNEPTLTQVAVVQADGTIQYPLVGRVFVGGMSAAEAADSLTRQLKKYLKHPVVSLGVQQQGAMSVTVLGNVKNPGKYQLRSGAHIGEAIAAAGGPNATNGAYPEARVTQADGSIAKVSLEKLFREGDAAQNVALDDNSAIYVTGAETIRVVVLGAVSRPGNVEVNVGDRLTSALARAGAEAAAKPDLNKVSLTRFDPATGKQQNYEINVYTGLKTNDPRYDPILQKDDRIIVPEARQLNGIAIGLLGVLGRLLGF